MENYRITDEEALPTPAKGAICMPLSWWTDVEPATLAREYSFFRVNNETDIAHIIRPPNAEDNDPVALARLANGGGFVLFGKEFVSAAISGPGFLRCLYIDEDVRIFESPKESPGRWEEQGLVVVQVRDALFADPVEGEL